MMQGVAIRRRVLVLAVVVAVFVVGWMAVSSRASAASATPVVYVATGENFPDALGASAAAAVQGGPVLLVTKDSIPAETKAELNRLSPDLIYVSGGTAVVSDSVFNELKTYAPSVIRVAGANRYATAVEVSKSAFPVTATGGGDTSAVEAALLALTARVDALEADNVTQASRISTLETKNAALEATLTGVTRNGDVLLFTGMNLQVVNGTGSTVGVPNSLGNVIIGYNENSSDARTGSHNLVIGPFHSWESHSGIVAGYNNTISGGYSSVSGGANNTASGYYSSVSGGYQNTASDYYSSVSGGYLNTASGNASSILGGSSKTINTFYGIYPPAP